MLYETATNHVFIIVQIHLLILYVQGLYTHAQHLIHIIVLTFSIAVDISPTVQRSRLA